MRQRALAHEEIFKHDELLLGESYRLGPAHILKFAFRDCETTRGTRGPTGVNGVCFETKIVWHCLQFYGVRHFSCHGVTYRSYLPLRFWLFFWRHPRVSFSGSEVYTCFLERKKNSSRRSDRARKRFSLPKVTPCPLFSLLVPKCHSRPHVAILARRTGNPGCEGGSRQEGLPVFVE